MSNNIDISMGIHNRFDIEVTDFKTGELKQTATGYNVICNNFWSQMSSLIQASSYSTGASFISRIMLGSGTGVPSQTDSTLFSAISGGSKTTGASLSTGVSIDAANGVSSVRVSIQFSETEINGSTITEVGLSNNGTNILTHALLEDINGNPISIEKTDTDIITVYSTLFLHWDPNGYISEDGSKIKVITDMNADYRCGTNLIHTFTTGFRTNLSDFSYGLGIAARPVVYPGRCSYVDVCTNGASVPENWYGKPSYNSATKTLTAGIARLPVSLSNVGGMHYMVIGYDGYRYISTW